MVKIRTVNNKRIYRSNIPLVIGYFSCVHVMHVQLLTQFHNFNVLTFSDFYTKRDNAIYSFNQRLNNLSKYKPENIYVMDLAKHNMTGLDFINKVLKPINPSQIVVGQDFKFGSDHKDVNFLRQFFKVETIKYNKQISSTKIVKDLKQGNLTHANHFLDEPYYYSSKWIEGRKLGRSIGFRTINLLVKDKLIIPEGTYITTVKLGSKTYPSLTFIGKSLTTESFVKTVECHILNKNILPRKVFSLLTRNNVKISFLKYLRKNRKFANYERLAAQIAKDKVAATKYFKENI